MTCRTPSATIPSSDLETNSRSLGPREREISRASPSTNLSQRVPSSTATVARQRPATSMQRPRHGLSDVQLTRPSHSAHSRNCVSPCRQLVDVDQSSVADITTLDASCRPSSRARLKLIAPPTSTANLWSTPSIGSGRRVRRSDLIQAA